MATNTGYKVNTDGLIFAFDIGDVVNSYKGAPTDNKLITVAGTTAGFTPWTVNGTNVDVTGTSEAGPIKDSSTWKFIKNGSSSQWNGWEASYGGIWTGASGDIWTTSYWYKTTAPAGVTNFGTGGFYTPDWSRAYNYTILADRNTIIADGTWRYNYTTTRINESYSNAIIVDGPSWGYSTSAGIMYINGLQWEKKSYPTAFAPGVRSVTQGLMNLQPTSPVTMDLTNATYDGVGNLYFDGTTGCIDLSTTGLITGNNPFTIEATYYTAATDSGGRAIITNYGSGNTSNTVWFASHGLFINGSVYHTSPPLTNGTYHTTVTRDTPGNVRLYKNGSLESTGTLTASITTGQNWRIGKDVNGNGEPFNGRIYQIKVYNRVLSADQIYNNYLLAKYRYGV
jgi:hypothetical protein